MLFMTTDQIKFQIYRKIDNLDASGLKELYGLITNYLNSKKDSSDWIGVSDYEKTEIGIAIEQLKENEGISHNDVMKALRKKYSNA